MPSSISSLSPPQNQNFVVPNIISIVCFLGTHPPINPALCSAQKFSAKINLTKVLSYLFPLNKSQDRSHRITSNIWKSCALFLLYCSLSFLKVAASSSATGWTIRPIESSIFALSRSERCRQSSFILTKSQKSTRSHSFSRSPSSMLPR